MRLHMLGDFYSLEYVQLWRRWLVRDPALRVFGYTAWHPSTPIGGALRFLARTNWDRFAIRLSSAAVGTRRTIVVAKAADAVKRGAIVCPAQEGKTRSCATCGLCWAPAAQRRTVAFLRHGMRGGVKKAE